MGGIRFIARAIALSLCALPAAALAADEPLQMTPASAWVMDYAEDSCALRRSFQAGDDQAILELRQFGPGDLFQVTLVSSTLSRKDREPRVRFEPDDEFHEPDAHVVDDGTLRGVVYDDLLRPNADKRQPSPLPDWPEAERDARERAITSLSVTDSFERNLVLQTGSMHEPMAAMRTCLDELLTHWGLDPAIFRTLSRQAAPLNVRSLARRIQSDSPFGLGRGGSRSVGIRIIVGPSGQPTACMPYKDFSSPGFGANACNIAMRHARFEPALDADGMPASGIYVMRIVL